MTNEIPVSPAQFTELRPAMAAFSEAQGRLISLSRLVIAGAGENPDRYSGNIIVREDGTVVIPLAPIAEMVPTPSNRAERRRAAKEKPAEPAKAAS